METADTRHGGNIRGFFTIELRCHLTEINLLIMGIVLCYRVLVCLAPVCRLTRVCVPVHQFTVTLT